ncbi:biorientation of chromosomes in cell division protein 1-like 1 isoform X2 [Corythoichthys intestinalis]|uniref:biorientation of chromosomes in cell division protein 1-like 1 isoform X2 n=1 Tax=Corythoichthys intestinalis TaxID=161448 RepID=UPI0025A5D836|nr:biorientation of chromosomes in cell division protein 1-like 1 isoform X2 [Corythoichthys intestinalis]
MASLPPGDPQLVSMIVNHLKTQGLFDQFRRDCLADVDTKPAYLNLKQRVDNFVSNHLSNHTWSPQLNKNQLRNNIRQLVLQSGMLEQGVDRIVAQVVDPKVNHIFRPQVEKVVHQLLSPGTSSEEPPPPPPPPSTENKADTVVPQQASSSTPTSTAATDAMSILDTITSLNQEANIKATEKERKTLDESADDGEQDMSLDEEEDRKTEEEEGNEAKPGIEVKEIEVNLDDPPDGLDVGKEISTEEVKMEEEEPRAEEQTEEKPKVGSKISGKHSEEKQEEDSCQAKQKAKERIKEEYSLEDSDLDGLSDITVSSVHTSDLSSFEEESEDEEPLSDSSEEGERASDGVISDKKEASEDTGEGRESKPRRKAYVHKPFLYSRYYSDSDDEVTVEERRRSAAKDKEERLLKRQQNRERLEEKRKQKAAQTEEQDQQKQKSNQSAVSETPRAKEARKERKVLEKKMALNRKRKLDSRNEGDVTSKKKGDAGETSKKPEVKSPPSRSLQQKPAILASDERHRRTSGSGGASEDSGEVKKLPDKNRTHSFILDLELGSQEALRQRSIGKFDRPSRKERKERDRSVSEELPKLKQKQEKKSELQVNESQQKDGASAKVSSDERSEKKPKGKNERRMSSTKEQKTSVPEVDEASTKRIRAQSVEKDKKEKDKDKIKEKEKFKGDKTTKSDSKQLLRGDSSGGLEERLEVTPSADVSKKKEKHSKDTLKRSKSHSEDRQGDKLKLKTENKEKTKTEQSNKTTGDSDKSPKRVKPADKGKTAEKSKSREEPKTSKIDRKIHGSDIRGKDKKKEVTVKEQRRSSDENLKKKMDKKEKDKKEESHEDKKTPKVEKPDFALPIEAEATHSEPLAASSSGDTHEPSSDMSSKGETQALEMPVVPPEADALLTLMDVCTSAMDARLHVAGERERTPLHVTLQDADMKMKEAALTLLSMDPDSALSPSFISHGMKEESEEAPPEENQQKPKTAPLTSELSAFASQAMTIDDDKLNNEDKAGMDVTSGQTPVVPAVLEDDTKSQESPSNEKEAKTGEEIAANSQPAEDQAAPADEHGKVEENTAVIPCETPNLEHVSTPQEQTEQDDETKTGAKTEEALAKKQAEVSNDLEMKKQDEERDAQIGDHSAPVTEGTSETEVAKQESESSDIHDQENESEVSEKERGRGRRKRKLSSQNAAVVNECVEDQDAKEPLIEETEQPKVMEVKMPRRGRSSKALEEVEDPATQLGKKEQTPSRRRRHSSSKGNSADEPAVKKRRSSKTEEDQEGDQMIKEAMAMDTSKEASVETSKDAAKETSEETEMTTIEETIKDTREEAQEDTCTREVAIQLKNEKPTEEKSKEEPSKDTQGEDVEDSKKELTKETNEEATDVVREAIIKEKCEMVTTETNEESLKDSNEVPVMDTNEEATEEEASKDAYEEPMMDTSEEALKMQGEGQQTHQNIASPSASPSKDNEDSGSERKTERVDEQQSSTPKKPARRGRPPKTTTPSDGSEKKDKTEAEQNDEDDDSGEKEDDGKEAMGRATTRLASRLEAERNKPSKPSTRASRQSGKDETATAARGMKGQVTATKGGRKLEASPPAVRTRGGQKTEEPPAKRAKR